MRAVKTIALVLLGSVLVLAMIADFSKAPSTSQAGAEAELASPSTGEGLSPEERARLEDEIASRVNPVNDTLHTVTSRNTRYGALEVLSGDDFENQLLFKGSALAIDDLNAYSLSLGPVWRIGDSDLLLAQIGSGGTACPASFILLVAKPDGFFHSKQFGDCSDLVRATQRSSKVILRIGAQAFSVDPNGVRPIRVTEAQAEEAEAEIDSPDSDLSNVFRPLIQPDMKMYRWCGILEQANFEDPKNAVFLVALGSREYKFYAISSREEQWSNLPIRIGGQFCVVGRYAFNSDARTVLGVPRTLPGLAAFRISTN